MAEFRTERNEGYPSLAARDNWGRYAAGMAVEALFVLFLTAAGFGLAYLAVAIWR